MFCLQIHALAYRAMDSTHDEKLSAVLKIYRSFNGKSVRVLVKKKNKQTNKQKKNKKAQSQQSQAKNTGENARYSCK